MLPKFYDDWVRGDSEMLAARWADDAIMETVFSVAPVPPQTAPPSMRGGETIRAFWRPIMAALERRELVDLWIVGLENPEWALARFKGDMHTKSGQSYRNSYNYLVRVRDGRIVEYYEYSNPFVILDAFIGEVTVSHRSE